MHRWPAEKQNGLSFPLAPLEQQAPRSLVVLAYRSAGLAVVFTLGEIEALAAALTRLLLFVLFPGTLLELERKQDNEWEVFYC